MDTLTPRLKEVGEQADYILRKVSLVVKENKELKSRLKELESQFSVMKQEKISLEDREKTIKLARTISSEEGGSAEIDELKKRINRYIREIDQCLKLINE